MSSAIFRFTTTWIIAVAALVSCFTVAAEPSPSLFQATLPNLPFPETALEPYISRFTLEVHHGKHHAKYVDTTNAMIAGTNFEHLSSLEEIMVEAHSTGNEGLFNNAAQSWNHAFYWNCMSPPTTTDNKSNAQEPTGLVLEKIIQSFGSYQEFRTQFANAGNTAFGSGWAWLVYRPQQDVLVVEKTIGAGNPMTNPGSIPILCMDVWEHAYYLDYKNLRTSYVDAFLDHLVNWPFVELNLKQAIESFGGGSKSSEL